MEYHYGMRLRGFSPGAQPTDGLIRAIDCTEGPYYSLLTYNRRLFLSEVNDYDLAEIGVTEKRWEATAR